MEIKDSHHHLDKPPEIISYYAMRRAIGILGITLPLILVAGSSLFGDCKEVQDSISTYYHTNMRNIFAGFIRNLLADQGSTDLQRQEL
ncbi:MAG: hypothetical protein E4H10_09205 [Bacteroidia bacterium]|nr:MAG: hypothetical protein E4H10_09205 [Bacteroidia bacterium]